MTDEQHKGALGARRWRIGMNAMANRTSKKSAKVAKKAADNHAESNTAMKKSKTASKEGKEEDAPSQLIDATRSYGSNVTTVGRYQ
jgi:hypothetical protein